jgi:hypothetical protein
MIQIYDKEDSEFHAAILWWGQIYTSVFCFAVLEI